MYRPNNLERNVLITADEVIFHGPVDHTFDHRKIEHAIIIAEERFIRPALTYNLYEEIAAAKNVLVTSLNKSTLEQQVNASMPAAEPVVLSIGDVINSSAFLSTTNLALWKAHLWKLCAECVLFVAFPDLFVQAGSAGLVQAAPATPMTAGGTVSPSLASVKWMMDKKLMDRITPLVNAMQDYICRQKKTSISLFTNYGNACACDTEAGPGRKTQFITGVYDDEPTNCCEWDQLRPL